MDHYILMQKHEGPQLNKTTIITWTLAMSAIIPLSTGISKKLQICGLLNPIQSESYEILSNFAVAYLSGGPPL